MIIVRTCSWPARHLMMDPTPLNPTEKLRFHNHHHHLNLFTNLTSGPNSNGGIIEGKIIHESSHITANFEQNVPILRVHIFGKLKGCILRVGLMFYVSNNSCGQRYMKSWIFEMGTILPEGALYCQLNTGKVRLCIFCYGKYNNIEFFMLRRTLQGTLCPLSSPASTDKASITDLSADHPERDCLLFTLHRRGNTGYQIAPWYS